MRAQVTGRARALADRASQSRDGRPSKGQRHSQAYMHCLSLRTVAHAEREEPVGRTANSLQVQLRRSPRRFPRHKHQVQSPKKGLIRGK